jgi:hypothetical protein
MRRQYAVVFGSLIVAISVGITVFALISYHPSSSSSSSAVQNWTAIGSFVLALVSLAVPAAGWLRSRYRRRKLTSRVGGAEAQLQYGNKDRGFATLTAEDRRLVEYIGDYPEKRQEREAAEAEIGRYLPPNPRRAKRIINHGRLYALIAEDRGIFGGDPELTYRHLAKWILIVEHWPRLGAALTRNPSRMTAIEGSISVEALQKAISDTAPGMRTTDELAEFLRGGIALSPVLARLVRFEAPG